MTILNLRKLLLWLLHPIEKCNSFPDLPTIDETVVNKKYIFSGYHVTSFLALMAPPSTWKEIIGKVWAYITLCVKV